jgi:hypothetical protein
VASDHRAISEDVIEGENGFVVDVSSSWDLRRVLTEIDRDPSRLERVLAATPKLRTGTAQVGELAEVYREVCFQRVRPMESSEPVVLNDG